MKVPEPKLEELRVADIVVRDRLRPVSEAGVESLLASIRDVGVMKDEIHVRLARRGGTTELRLLAGAHRLEAARRLGWETIRAKVWRDINDTLAGFIEVDDNLAGAEMGALDTAVFLVRRKELYETAHPEARRGGDRKSQLFKNQTDINDSLISFVSATAEKFGLSPRHVYRLVAAGRLLSANDVHQLRAAPRPVTQADLQTLSKIGASADRIAVVERLARGDAKSAGAALKQLRGPKAPADPRDQQMAALKVAWSRADAAVRRAWVATAAADLARLLEESE